MQKLKKAILAAAAICTITSNASYAQQTVANAEIVKLVKAALPDAIILGKIAELKAKSPTGLDDSTDALIALKEAGASDAVLNAFAAPAMQTQPQQQTKSQVVMAPIRFKNAEVEFTSLLVSTDKIRVNLSVRNIVQKPIYLWNSSEQNKRCTDVSLTDEQGSDFKCNTETAYAFNPYSKGDSGMTIEPGSAVAVQYVFDRQETPPGKSFSFSAVPFLSVAKPPQDVKSGAFYASELYNFETLGVTFSDVEAKIRPTGL